MEGPIAVTAHASPPVPMSSAALPPAAMPVGPVPPAALRVRALRHAYTGGAGTVAALADVDLDVAPGEFVALVGPSGCGKTTLLRAAGGLLVPGGGEVLVGGAPPRMAAARHALGLVGQEPGLLPWRRVAANVALALRLAGRPAPAGEVAALLRRVGIEAFADAYPAELSGGMRQRVALARALAHRPALLLMDEPFGALDELSREALGRELLTLWAADRPAVLFVTHAIAEAVRLADRVVVLGPRPGRVVADLPVPLPRPRPPGVEETAAFLDTVRRARAALARDGGAR